MELGARNRLKEKVILSEEGLITWKLKLGVGSGNIVTAYTSLVIKCVAGNQDVVKQRSK